MPQDMGYDYLGMSFQQKLAERGVSSTTIFGISILFVFLILAALYESWALPFSVLLSTLDGLIFRGFWGVAPAAPVHQPFYPAYMVDMENDVYSQIDLVMLIDSGGEERNPDRGVCQGRIREGAGRWSTPRSQVQRLRLAAHFPDDLLGVPCSAALPSGLARAPGPLHVESLGSTVIGGMLAAASAVGIFFIPAIFYVVETLSRRQA